MAFKTTRLFSVVLGVALITPTLVLGSEALKKVPKHQRQNSWFEQARKDLHAKPQFDPK